MHYRHPLAYALALIHHRVLITDDELGVILNALEVLIRILSRVIQYATLCLFNHRIRSYAEILKLSIRIEILDVRVQI